MEGPANFPSARSPSNAEGHRGGGLSAVLRERGVTAHSEHIGDTFGLCLNGGQSAVAGVSQDGRAVASTIPIAWKGQTSMHALQPVQRVGSCSMEDLTQPRGSRDSTCGAHAATQRPHPVQRSVLMSGRTVRVTNSSAFDPGTADKSIRADVKKGPRLATRPLETSGSPTWTRTRELQISGPDVAAVRFRRQSGRRTGE
jgi:hypothetical protein